MRRRIGAAGPVALIMNRNMVEGRSRHAARGRGAGLKGRARDLAVLRVALVGMSAALAGAGCGDAGSGSGIQLLAKDDLMDPATCKGCHPLQFADWQASMHAYAAEDPVFRAMNRRAQRATPALGQFCVRCHAPVAVAEGLTTDGLDLDALPAKARGVTCYFCHSAAAVNGTHNNPLALAKDGTLFGPFSDPVAAPHRSQYSELMDFSQAGSAAACGTCHDITNQHEVPLERTYQEWQQTLFVDPAVGQTCARCHMAASDGPASTTSPTKLRSLRSHAFPGVDVALTAAGGAAAVTDGTPELARQAVQAALDSTLQGTLCLTDANTIEVTLDNAGAGHAWPSGATQDRRAWVEVVAYVGTRIVYQSGVVPADRTVETLGDPDLWLIRDCIFDGQGQEVHDFWAAESIAASNQIPGPVKATIKDPTTFSRSHVRSLYPKQGSLTERPDRITMHVFLKPVGDDVLADLVASGDLDPGVVQSVPTFDVAWGSTVEWTSEAEAPIDIQTRAPVPGITCVGPQTQQYRKLDTVATSRAICVAGTAPAAPAGP